VTSTTTKQITVVDARYLALVPNRTVLLIDSEQMLFTGIGSSSNILLVQRSYNGVQATHNAGAGVYPAFDQRGPGYPRVVGGQIDIGAFQATGTSSPATSFGPGGGAGPATGDLPQSPLEAGSVLAVDPGAAAPVAPASVGLTPEQADLVFLDQGAAAANPAPEVAVPVTATPDSSGDSGLGGDALSLADLLPVVS
jgi:hypothetical protein